MIENLSQNWLDAKHAERVATDRRRELEDKLLSLIGVAENMEGTESVETDGGYKIKITGRMTRKVNAERLQELAAENGLSDHLASLFKWTPTIVSDQWESADPSITEPLLDAITTTAGRPTFKIIVKE